MRKKYYILWLLMLTIIFTYIIVNIIMSNKSENPSIGDALPPSKIPNFIINSEVWEK